MVSRTRNKLHRAERGQALLEAAPVLPVLFFLAFGVVMVGRVVHAKIAVQAAAREGGRAMATAPSQERALAEGRNAVERAAVGYGLGQDHFSAELDASDFARGGRVHALVTYRVLLADLPFLSQTDLRVSASHAERIDLYRSRERSLR